MIIPTLMGTLQDPWHCNEVSERPIAEPMRPATQMELKAMARARTEGRAESWRLPEEGTSAS